VPGEVLGIDRQVVGGDFVSEFFGKTAMAIRRRMGPVRARHGLGPGTGAAERVLRHVSHHVVDARGLPSQAFSLGFLRFLEARWRRDACLSKRRRVDTNLDWGDRSHLREMHTQDLPFVPLSRGRRCSQDRHFSRRREVRDVGVYLERHHLAAGQGEEGMSAGGPGE